jgi:hypothetical protein
MSERRKSQSTGDVWFKDVDPDTGTKRIIYEKKKSSFVHYDKYGNVRRRVDVCVFEECLLSL